MSAAAENSMSSGNLGRNERTLKTADALINAQIRRHELLKNAVKTLFGVFMVMGLFYVLYSLWGNNVDAAKVKLESNLKCSADGKLIVVSIINDSTRCILISTDSGKSFSIKGGPWRVNSNTVDILIAPISNEIIVVDGSDKYYISKKPFISFLEYKLAKPIAATDGIKGIYYSPSKNSVYLYGSMGYLVNFNLSNPDVQQEIFFSDTYRPISLAMDDEENEVKAIATSRNNRDTFLLEHIDLTGKGFVPETKYDSLNVQQKSNPYNPAQSDNNSKK